MPLSVSWCEVPTLMNDRPDAADSNLNQPSPAVSNDESLALETLDELLTPNSPPPRTPVGVKGMIGPLALVETAFLASTASLIWFVNYYFPLGPVLRIFFPLPIALAYLRWGSRAAWMGAAVSGLLLTVLMGPTRSILFVIPFGVMGVQLGATWRRGANWAISIGLGTLLGSFGFFFRIWLVSLLLGDDLWVYITVQMTELLETLFTKLGWLIEPSLGMIQAIAIFFVVLNNLIYLFVVHLVAALLLERLGNPLPTPPQWVQRLLEYED